MRIYDIVLESILKNNEKLKEEGEEINSNPEKRPIDDMRNEFEEKKEDKQDKNN